MVDAQQLVKVYSFKRLTSRFEMPELASYKATLETITRLDGEPLPGTEEAVARESLDDQGRYRRVNSGWAALD